MTIGVLGDVPAEGETLRAASEFFAAVGVDRVVCVGGVSDGAGDAERRRAGSERASPVRPRRR